MARRSNYNAYHERMLDANLNVAEDRLAISLMRLTYGWSRDGDHLGRKLIRDTSRLDGRTLERARQGLVDKGLLLHIPGKPGRGNRSYYELLLEKAVPPRPIEEEKAATGRPKTQPIKGRFGGTKKAAPQRPRSTQEEKNSAHSAPTNNLHRRVFDTYQKAAGEPLELDKERGALARSVKSATAAGHTDTEILAALADLGRKREFPGLLKQRMAELEEQGGACTWEGLNRSQLTPEQLNTCTCNLCTQWATAINGNEHRCQEIEAYYQENFGGLDDTK